jgi:protocatechuate 3,4-dioxygenase beta subunit
VPELSGAEQHLFDGIATAVALSFHPPHLDTEGTLMSHQSDHDDAHDLGLGYDLGVLRDRRHVLKLVGVAGAGAFLAGCDRLPFIGGAEAEVTGTGNDGSVCVAHPAETAGPFPADGSNRAHGTLANVLAESGIVRTDMRPNIGAGGGRTAAGIKLDLTLRLVDVRQSCKPLAGHAIYLWHCDAEGRYSIYDLPEATYLRAVGVTDGRGAVTFATIVPGCYLGRAPHMHFEVYPSLAKATDYRTRILTSQLAVPGAVCKAAYAGAEAYKSSLANFARTPPTERDGIFADNTPAQLAAQTLKVRGSPADGYQATVVVGV